MHRMNDILWSLIGERGPEIIDITNHSDKGRVFLTTDGEVYSDSTDYGYKPPVYFTKCGYCGVSSEEKFGLCPHCGAPL